MMTQVATGVCSRGLTLAIVLENGSWLSRAIPKASRIVEVRIGHAAHEDRRRRRRTGRGP